MKFKYNLQLYIPSQNNDNVKIDVMTTLEEMKINAFTLTKGIGSWNQYTEEINIVEIFVETEKDLTRIINDFLIMMFSSILGYSQEAVSFKVNGIPYIIESDYDILGFNKFLKGVL